MRNRSSAVVIAALVMVLASAGAADQHAGNRVGGAEAQGLLASSAYFNSLSGYTDTTSTNRVTATFTVTGTTNDTGTGSDRVTLEIHDDFVLKASQEFQIPVGATQTKTATLTWSGPIGTVVPGVGVYLYDTPSTTARLAYQDPFYLSGELALSIEKSAATSVPSGNNLTYTITYGNPRSTSVSSVVIRDTVPSGTTFVSASGGGTHSGGVVTWNIGTLLASTTGRTVTMTVRVSAASGSTVVNSTYSIQGSGVSAVSGAPVTTSVTPPAPLIASFTFSPTSPTVGQTVYFTDTSSGFPTSWSWDFGDGGTSTSRNPSRTYATAGSKLVKLTVSNANDSDSGSRTITVLSPSATIGDLDAIRSPHSVVARAGDTLHLYFTLRDGAGNNLSAASIGYVLEFAGFTPSSGGVTLSQPVAGALKVTLVADKLNLPTGSTGTITFPTGTGTIQLDSKTYDVTSAPAAVSILKSAVRFVDQWDLFAGASAGATGCLGVCVSDPNDNVTVSLAAAKLSVKGAAGVGLTTVLDADGRLTFERRLEGSVAGSVEVPSASLKSKHAGTLSGPGVRAGLERGFTRTQVFSYAGSGEPLSSEARMMNAACFLETASLGGVAAGPGVALVLKALVSTLNSLSGANLLVAQGLREERSGTTVAGYLSPTLFSYSTPGVEVGRTGAELGGLSFGMAATWKAAVAVERSVLYRTTAGGRTVDGYLSSFTGAPGGNSAPLPLPRQLDLGFFSFGLNLSDVTQEVRLTPARAPSAVALSFHSQTSAGLDLGLFRAQTYQAHAVTAEVTNPSVVNGLIDDSSTGLKALAGTAGHSLSLGEAAIGARAEAMLERAKNLAPAGGVAYTVTADRVSGRVLGVFPRLSIDIPLGLFTISPELGLDLQYSQQRTLEGVRRAAATSAADWPLQESGTAPDWQSSPSLTSVISSRVVSGIGPLIKNAAENLWGQLKDLIGAGGTATVLSGSTVYEFSVDDPVSGLRAGTVRFPTAYVGRELHFVGGDPSRLERFGRGSARLGTATTAVRWAYTTTRVLPEHFDAGDVAQARTLAAASDDLLVLVGDYVDVQVFNGSTPLSAFSPAATLALPLYAMQAARMGADPAKLREARIVRYDEATRAWQLVPGSPSGDGVAVTASISQPGSYAPGLVIAATPGDSDGDGIPDNEEDPNGNGIVDPGETDPFAWDSDGDGVSDGDERAAGTDPLDPNSVPNRAPLLGFIGNQEVDIEGQLELPIRAEDPDGNPLYFWADGLPRGAAIDSSTGVLTWTPQAEGQWRVTVNVQDQPTAGRPLADSETFLLIARSIVPSITAPGANVVIIPTSAHSGGAAGSFWVSDAVLHNPGASAARANLYFLLRGQDNSATEGVRVSIPPGGALKLADFVATQFGKTSAAGALLIGSAADLLITSRTFNNAASGTYGQYVPSFPAAAALAAGQEARLIQLTKNSTYRTNIGVANLGGVTTQVNVELRRADGSVIGTRAVTLKPYSFHQEDDVIGKLTAASVDDGYAVVSSTTAQAAYVAYASVIDNRTNDPICVVPASALGAGDVAFVPAAAHLAGVGGALWRTDLEVHNPGSTRATFTLELLERDRDNASPFPVSLALDGGRARRFDDVLRTLFDFTGAATLRVTPTAGSVMVTSRTYNLRSSGTFGQFIPAQPLAAAAGTGQELRLLQLAQSDTTTAGFRTNLGLVNATTAPLTAEVELRRGDGALLGSKSYDLRPLEFVQIDRVFATVTTQAVPDGFAVVRPITPGGAVLAYASVIDNRSGDPVYIPGLRPGASASEIAVSLPGGVPLTLERIPAGTFTMGATSTERGYNANDGPPYKVTLTQHYYLGKYEVTQRQWLAVMGSNPSYFTGCGLDCPVERVSWNDICGGATGSSCTPSSFIGQLNAHLTATGQAGAGDFRLPTEAEWERAVRGGTTGPFSFDTSANPSWDTECGSLPEALSYMWWCGNNSPEGTKPVGRKLANPHGLHDMHGNVWEWVGDWYGSYPTGTVTDPMGPSSGSGRIWRGGSWNGGAQYCRSAMRGDDPPGYRNETLGFRLARSAASTTCIYSISPVSRNHGAGAETGTVSVTVGSGCTWTAASNAGWITITSGASGSGNGSVGYSVAANGTTSARSGTLTIASQTFTVTQAGVNCTYAISPVSRNHGAGAATATLSVTGGIGCAWAAVSDAGWISIVSGASGIGDGTVAYSVAANGSTSSRSGTLRIAGHTFTVTQALGGPPGEVTVTLPGNLTLVMVQIPAGTFMMGPAYQEHGRIVGEEQQHQVTLTQDYYLGKFEVTQRQWAAIMGSNPSYHTSCGPDCPVEVVSWNDICGGATGSSCTSTSFIGKLNAHLAATKQPGAGNFRLPTEAEWERAARGGTTGPFSFDTSANPSWDLECGSFPQAEGFMWWCNNAGSTTHPVGQKLPNPYGLFDMHGNVWEWVGDWYGAYPSGPVTDPPGPSAGSYRLFRGGSWKSSARSCRSAWRLDKNIPQLRDFVLGFRLASSVCSYSITPTTRSHGAEPEVGTVSVTAGSGCTWTAASDVGWITITSGASGSGSGTVGYLVVANATTSPRTGNVTIAGQSFTVTQAAGSVAREITVTLPGGVSLTLVRVFSAGTFMMGSPESERGRNSDETEHQVTLTQDYYLGKFEVTQRQWQAVMGAPMPTSCGSYGVSDNYPVYCVSWNDICGGTSGSSCSSSSFIGKLNAHLTGTGQPGAGKFRMPTEAEWERAARGGTAGPFSFDTSANPSWDTGCGSFPQAEGSMWWCNNAMYATPQGTRQVGTKLPNPYGLFDMHGNVFEWVADWLWSYPFGAVTDPPGPSTGYLRVFRGGGFGSLAQYCRSASRSGNVPDSRYYYVGFRLARSQ